MHAKSPLSQRSATVESRIVPDGTFSFLELAWLLRGVFFEMEGPVTSVQVHVGSINQGIPRYVVSGDIPEKVSFHTTSPDFEYEELIPEAFPFLYN
jgi:hypothetical protein